MYNIEGRWFIRHARLVYSCFWERERESAGLGNLWRRLFLLLKRATRLAARFLVFALSFLWCSQRGFLASFFRSLSRGSFSGRRVIER